MANRYDLWAKQYDLASCIPFHSLLYTVNPSWRYRTNSERLVDAVQPGADHVCLAPFQPAHDQVPGVQLLDPVADLLKSDNEL